MQLLTAAEARTRLRVSHKELARLVMEEGLRFVRLTPNGRRKYNADDLDEFVLRHTLTVECPSVVAIHDAIQRLGRTA